MARDPEARDFLGLKSGERPRVFVGSLMDWAECRDDEQRAIVSEAWPIIRDATEVDFLLLTKRPQNIPDLLPADWGDGYRNVWMMTSVESGLSKHRDRLTGEPVLSRAQLLLQVPAVVHGVSYEPAIGPLAEEIAPFLHDSDCDVHSQQWSWDELSCSCAPSARRISWIIYGGESGPGFRQEGEPGKPKIWARDMREVCRDAGVAFFHKQSAAFRNETGVDLDGEVIHEFPVTERGTL